jgi:hypothetical protein
VGHQWKLSNLEVVQGFSAGSLTAWIVGTPAGGGRSVDTPAGVKRRGLPPPGLSGFVGQVPVEGGSADPGVLRYVPREMAIGLHGLGCREMFTSSALSAR